MGRRVRAALNTQEGVKKILISGLQASVVMEEGKSLDKEKVSKALKEQRIEFVSLTETEMPLPKASYVLQAQGAT